VKEPLKETHFFPFFCASGNPWRFLEVLAINVSRTRPPTCCTYRTSVFCSEMGPAGDGLRWRQPGLFVGTVGLASSGRCCTGQDTWGRSTRQVVEVATCRRTLRRSALTGQLSRPTVVWEASGGRVLHWTATTHIRLHYAVHNVVCIFRLEANPPSSIISRWMTNSRKEQHTY
jgi:hypothetical protein